MRSVYFSFLCLLAFFSWSCRSTVALDAPTESSNLVANDQHSLANKTTASDHLDVSNYDSSVGWRDLLSRTPGVYVKGSGQNLSIQIRGRKTMMTSSEPLFVLEDRIMGYGFESISWVDPGMVRSIRVLKGGASASEYGARGANGVIVVDLKK